MFAQQTTWDASAFAGTRLAILELGTNSFHLLVAQSAARDGFRVIRHEKRRVQLGDESYRTGRLSPAAIQRGKRAVAELTGAARDAGATNIIGVATSAVRDAENGEAFVRCAARVGGVEVRVIDGLEEARLAFLGARYGCPLRGQNVALFDFGGGSTEVVLADARGCRYRASLPLGALRLRAQWRCCDPPTGRDLRDLESLIAERLGPIQKRVRAFQCDSVVMSCGAARRLLRLAIRAFGEDPKTDRLTRSTLGRIEDRLSSSLHSELHSLTGSDARVDTALPGATALRVILDCAQAESATVAPTGLREGLLVDLLGHAGSDRTVVHDARAD